MDPSLIKKNGLLMQALLVFRNGDLYETNSILIDFLSQEMFSINFLSGSHSVVFLLKFLNQSLRLSGSKAWKELKLVVTVVKLMDVINVYTDIIQHYNINFLEHIHKSSFINMLLQGM
jgi:hypothetical protein